MWPGECGYTHPLQCGLDWAFAVARIVALRICLFACGEGQRGKAPSYIDGGGFASLPQANAKGHDPSFIRCAFAEGKAPSYIDGGGVYNPS